MTLIIGVSARKGGGKTTVGENCKDFFSKEWVKGDKRCTPNVGIYYFATKLKTFCHELLGVPWELMNGTDADKNTKMSHILWENMPGYGRYILKKINSVGSHIDALKITGPMSVREIMQCAGTEIIRQWYPQAHVEGCLRQIDKDKPKVACILDMRFFNEADAVKSRGGYTVRLTRNPHGGDTHVSETALDDYKFDHVIDNANLTLEATQEAFNNYVLGLL